jgi:diguanylate cyclase (GGDEF)-like protein/PAS domain S-box-containing protein
MPGMRKPSAKKDGKQVQANSVNPDAGPSLAEALLQSAGSGIYIVQDNKFAYINPYFTELSGYSLQELDGKQSLDLVYPDDRDSVKKQAATRLKQGRSVHPYEYRFVKKNGEVIWVMERITSIEYMGRRAALGSFMDINRRKDLEKAITESEQRHRAILDQMHDACFEMDLSGKFVFTNSYMCRNLQRKHDELIGKNFRLIIPEGDVAAIMAIFQKIYQTGHPATAFSHRVKRKDGIELFVESSVSLIRDDRGKPTGYICVARDISERKQLQQALARSEERFRNVLERMQDSYHEVDLAGNFTFVNEAMSRELLYTREELIGQSYKMIMSEEEAKRVFDVFHRVFLTGEPNPGFAFMVTRKDGLTGYAEASISLLKDAQEKPVGFNSISRNITERKELEEALSQSELRYRTVLEEMYDSYYEVDLAGNFIFVNDSVCNNLGYTREDLIGRNFSSNVPPDEVKKLFAAFNEVFRTGIPNKGFAHGVLRKDGTMLYAETSIALRKNETGQVIGFRSISRDATQRMEFEQRLTDMATHDFLTGLPNRVLLHDRLQLALAQAHRNKNKLGIMTLDLNRFKAVNDTLGHHIGDELLKAIGQRLTGIIRSADTIARMGGDEFMLLMPELHQSDNIEKITAKIVEAFRGAFIIEGHRLYMSASVGIAIYPDDGMDMDTLMRKSDAAMYDIKNHGPSPPLQV